MTQKKRISSYSPEPSTSSITNTPKTKYGHPRHRHNEKIYKNYSESSESEVPENNVDEYEEDGDEEDWGIYTDNSDSDAYTDSEVVPETPMNQSYQSSTNPEVVTMKSASNFHDLMQTTYMNIAPLPMFRGGPNECPITHLSRFIKVCRANNVSSIEMMMRIFPVTLDEEAALWYDLEIEPSPSLTWEEIKAAFLKVYRKMEFVDQFRSELMRLRQGENESVYAYFLRMQWMLSKWPDHSVPEGVLKVIFIDGLDHDFQDWIDQQTPNSLNEAVRLALAWEHAKVIRNGRTKKNMMKTDKKCGFCEGMHEERECEVREKLRELWLKNRDKKLKASSVECEMDEAPKRELGKSESKRSTSRQGEQEEEEGGEGGLNVKKKPQCQCWKHQCWKKTLEKNNSIISRTSKAAE